MNHERFDADIALTMGPCADFEFDLVELSERTLPAERAPLVQQHLAHCARCSAYLAALVDLDTTLAAALPRPELSADFDARVAARVDALGRSPTRSAAMAAENDDYRKLLLAIGRILDWRTALNAIASATAAGGTIVASMLVAPDVLAALGPEAPTVAAGCIAVAALAAGLTVHFRSGSRLA